MINNRLERLRNKFADEEIDAFIISQAENRRYISGFEGSSGFVLVTAQKAVLATDFRYTEQAVSQSPNCEILRIANNMDDWLPKLLGELGVRRPGFEAGDITVEVHQQLTKALKQKQIAAELVPITGLVESLRAVKEAGEIELIREAVAIADAAFDSVEGTIKAGLTEQQVAWEIEKHLRENGSQPVPFEIIVASGPNSALPHAKPSARVINAGEPVLIDMGARYGGYTSDLSRTIYVGEADATFKRVYSAVLDAQLEAMSIIKEGTTGHQADSYARKVIEKAGYGEAFGHALGHGLGLAAHELPRLGPNSHEKLSEGMVFTVEPGIYLSGWGGVRIEDTVTIEKGKVAAMSKAKKVRYD